MQGRKAVITIFTEMSLHRTPEELNEIDFTMEFWQKDAHMASRFDDLLYESESVRVTSVPENRAAVQEFKNAFRTTVRAT